MDYKTLGLTKKQYHYLLYILATGDSLKKCAQKFDIQESALHSLLQRVETKYPGFRKRLNDVRRITDTDTGKYPMVMTGLDLDNVPDDYEDTNQFCPFSSSELSSGECDKPRKSDLFRRAHGRIITKF